MKIKHKIVLCIVITVLVTFSFSTTALATVTESEVQAQVNSQGSEAVTGNIFIWFLCAVAFLKISQKIDSFMSSLGINVGNTGGSMIAELMVASKGLALGRSIFSGGLVGAGARGATGASGASGANGSTGLMSGGLAGVVGRSVNRGAAQSATTGDGGGIGGLAYTSSVEKGGSFANNVISSVAKGHITADGSITGDNAVQAFNSYMGYTELTESANISQNVSGGSVNSASPDSIASYSNIEIGGGRITGTETSTENPSGIQFRMYNTEQYTQPKGNYETVSAVDGSQWYKQYAQDAVDKTPYMAPDGSIAYNESLVKRLPDMPRRKDRI